MFILTHQTHRRRHSMAANRHFMPGIFAHDLRCKLLACYELGLAIPCICRCFMLPPMGGPTHRLGDLRGIPSQGLAVPKVAIYILPNFHLIVNSFLHLTTALLCNLPSLARSASKGIRPWLAFRACVARTRKRNGPRKCARPSREGRSSSRLPAHFRWRLAVLPQPQPAAARCWAERRRPRRWRARLLPAEREPPRPAHRFRLGS